MISASSAFASSTPATSCQRTIESDSGLSSAGAVRGITLTNRHIRYTRNPSSSGGIQSSRNVLIWSRAAPIAVARVAVSTPPVSA